MKLLKELEKKTVQMNNIYKDVITQ